MIAQSLNIVKINKACSRIDKMCQYGMWEVAGNSYVSICIYALQLWAKFLGNYLTENDTNMCEYNTWHEYNTRHGDCIECVLPWNTKKNI